MWNKACDTAARCISEAKEYNNQRYDKTHKDLDLRGGDQVQVPALRFNNLKGTKKMRNLFLGPSTIIILIGNIAVEVRLIEQFSRKHPVFLVTLIKTYHQTGDDKFPFRTKSHTPQEIVEVEDPPGAVKKIMKARSIRLNGKYHTQYLVGFKNQKAGTYKLVADYAIPDFDLNMRIFRAFRRDKQSYK
ncbi:hypothetical protein O181_017074 [Austropuccinia psidii MF-1]|uniref:Uncharacterized protein n=1 Tax=Austropuccinia psidii MF-1 TaxID=1389203 RepID=A0A9Q3C2V4_9BASI|nr:hypothetical protein [Austropuccinia psidii MF-1]